MASSTKILIIRFSSLGDVILSTSVLVPLKPGDKVDWLVAREFVGVLEGHPCVRQVISFDRRSGLSGLVRLAGRIRAERYTEIWDLHGSLRSKFLRLFCALGGRGPKWRVQPKEKFRHLLFLALKKRLPVCLRPRQKRVLSAEIAGGLGQERPDLTHFSPSEPLSIVRDLPDLPLMAVMPASHWEGKCWPVESFEEVCVRLKGRVYPIVFGTGRDRASLDLVNRLVARGAPHLSGIGVWSLKDAAAVLSSATFYLGNDTGLAHLAEAVGTPVWVIHGPTSPELGFGPSHPDSRVLSVELGCRPCSKDGRICWRIHEPRACLKRLHARDVAEAIEKAIPSMTLRHKK